MEEELKAVESLVNTLIEFAVAYGFQIFGAVIFLLIGLKIASWIGGKVSDLCVRKDMDVTLSGFVGSIVKVVIVVFVAIITLGNFGISTAPLIALAGAGAFGATLAIQGPLSNYGAGLSIILARPFTVGDTISVKGINGVVHEVKLAATVLVGEDKEMITVPNKKIVGEVIVNSDAYRIVEARIPIASNTDCNKVISALRSCLESEEDVPKEPRVQVGVHDFTYGGVIIGLRYWVPSQRYFQTRYKINQDLLTTLIDIGVTPLTVMETGMTLPMTDTSADEEEMV